MPQPTPLTPQEEVLVKEVWNKLRSWKELQIEKFFKRLLLEELDLQYLFGEAIDSMADFLYELFDCCIHQLQPETQNIIGELAKSRSGDRFASGFLASNREESLRARLDAGKRTSIMAVTEQSAM
ncbi:MAG: hypothetical protein RMZ69_23695 [Nostoc sp. ChiQUE01a]|nr:hypothetical protein [Nostoc sp. ChiQUE01a]